MDGVKIEIFNTARAGRVMAAGFPESTTEELLELLRDSRDWVRLSAVQQLAERGVRTPTGDERRQLKTHGVDV